MTGGTPSILNAAAVLRGGPCRPVERLVKARPRAYEGIKMLQLLHEIAGVPRAGVPLERLEPCEGKLSRTVPRGARAG